MLATIAYFVIVAGVVALWFMVFWHVWGPSIRKYGWAIPIPICSCGEKDCGEEEEDG